VFLVGKLRVLMNIAPPSKQLCFDGGDRSAYGRRKLIVDRLRRCRGACQG
jgi:hypothetical protein